MLLQKAATALPPDANRLFRFVNRETGKIVIADQLVMQAVLLIVNLIFHNTLLIGSP